MSYSYKKGGFNRGDRHERPERHENGGEFRHDRKPYEKRPPREEIDPNSNFRLYYEKDPNFYRVVITTEEPAPPTFEFKLQLFKDMDYQPREGDPILVFASPDYNMVVQDILMDLGAENFRFQTFRHYETPDKHRVFFSVKEREQALAIYDKFQKYLVPIPAARSKLYYSRPEEVFVKFGDSEAEKYYAKQEELKAA